MSRSARLTGVFALVVGIVLTLGANPRAAQPQARAHVYLLRGLFSVFMVDELAGASCFGFEAIDPAKCGFNPQ